MADYQLAAYDWVVRSSDGVAIPPDPRNRDWVAYQQWLDDGGVPDPAAETTLGKSPQVAKTTINPKEM